MKPYQLLQGTHCSGLAHLNGRRVSMKQSSNQPFVLESVEAKEMEMWQLSAVP